MADVVQHLLQELVKFLDEATGAFDAVVVVVQRGLSPFAAS